MKAVTKMLQSNKLQQLVSGVSVMIDINHCHMYLHELLNIRL